ncbi:helix-turn-helix domain-containing protein [Kitasatospora sp. NPDC051853]|uniref:helix-turn-helix domain-containing protein n=1 Tax=Kitasatospora sp. NPDC051853 TaxID=3364058 RepID=UPI0037ABD477
MGRPERPITSFSEEIAALAMDLRAHRQRAGLSYAQLAEMARMDRTRLSRAASGKSVPPMAVVEAYLTGCGATKKQIARTRGLWRAARRAGRQRPEEAPQHIALIKDRLGLSVAMQHLYLKIGRPSLRDLERQAGAHGELPRSSLSRVLRGDAPPNRALLEAFVKACAVPASEIETWLEAWDRVNRPRRHEGANHFHSPALALRAARANQLLATSGPDD